MHAISEGYTLLYYVWFQESIEERKKYGKENDFLMFGFIIEKYEIKNNSNQLKTQVFSNDLIFI